MVSSLKSNLRLDDWQVQFLHTVGNKILCCGRQIGKSVICGHDAGEYAAKNKKKVVLMIAPTERQAYALFEKTLQYLMDFYPKLIKTGKYRPTKKNINLKNGTTIWCLPTGLSGIGIRFLTVDRLYCDEASRIPDDVWTAITPMLMTTGGDMIILSTPFGTRGRFYEIWDNKDEAYFNFTRFSFSSREVLEKREICTTWTKFQRDKALEYIDSEEKRMSRLEFAQEYLGMPMQDLKQVYPDELLKKICVLKRRKNISREGVYYSGSDIAGMGKDESVHVAVDRTNKKNIQQVECVIMKHNLTTENSKFLIDWNAKYNFRRQYIDDGGLGFGVFSEMLTNPKTKRKVVAINNAAKVIERNVVDGKIKEQYKKVLKEELHNNLLNLMEKRHIQLLDDPEIFQSLKSVQFEIEKNRVRYIGNYTHIAEAIIRAAWCVKDNYKKIKIY